jgi:glutamyl-tRNA synthetase
VAIAGSSFFREAVAAIEAHGTDFKAFSNQVKERTGAKGKELFMPLRAALTGEEGGPEMARLLSLIGAERARRRLAAWVQ